MIIPNDEISQLDILLQKSLCYKYHMENYIPSLEEKVTIGIENGIRNQHLLQFWKILWLSGKTS